MVLFFWLALHCFRGWRSNTPTAIGGKIGGLSKGDVWIKFHPLKLRNVFPSVKKTGQHGGVALIIPYVGNLSHIKLTPNFHTCSPTCWKSSNSLNHTHTHVHTRVVPHTNMRCWVGSGRGFPPSVWEGNRDITGQDQESPRACSAYLHPMQQNSLSTKAVLTLSSPFVITLTKLILTSSSHIWKTPELDVVLTQLPESMLWLQNQMRAVLKSSTVNLLNWNQSVENILILWTHSFILLHWSLNNTQAAAAAVVVKKWCLSGWETVETECFLLHLHETSYSSVWQADVPGLPWSTTGTLATQRQLDRCTRSMLFFGQFSHILALQKWHGTQTPHTGWNSTISHRFPCPPSKRHKIIIIGDADKTWLLTNSSKISRLPQSCGSLPL